MCSLVLLWHVLRAVGPEGLLWSACSEQWRGAHSVRGFGFILFVMRWIIPLCLILTAFFPPSPERAETSARKPLFFGYNAYAVGLMVGVRGP